MPGQPSSEELLRAKAAYDGALAGLEPLETKRLFGCDGYFAQGNLFALVSKEGRLGLRLPDPASREELLAAEGAEAWHVGGSAVKLWVLVPPAWVRQPARLRAWVRRAHEQARVRPARPAVTRRGEKKVSPARFPKVSRPKRPEA